MSPLEQDTTYYHPETYHGHDSFSVIGQLDLTWSWIHPWTGVSYVQRPSHPPYELDLPSSLWTEPCSSLPDSFAALAELGTYDHAALFGWGSDVM